MSDRLSVLQSPQASPGGHLASQSMMFGGAATAMVNCESILGQARNRSSILVQALVECLVVVLWLVYVSVPWGLVLLK
jgi:hypothetical protein